jgi:hypothetical protein
LSEEIVMLRPEASIVHAAGSHPLNSGENADRCFVPQHDKNDGMFALGTSILRQAQDEGMVALGIAADTSSAHKACRRMSG